jgi:3-oxoacyl-[acyl-carrier-protein] synthase-3
VPEAAVLGVAPVAASAASRLPSVQMVSVATEIPPGRVTSAELAAQFGVEEDWIVSRTGIRERPWTVPGDRLDDFSARAGAKALAAAGVAAADLDLVIVATITADEVTPAAAPQVARALGADRAGAFDIGAACSGFLTGIALAAGQIESGRARAVLLIGADFVSRLTDKTDRYSAPLFSDAAGATVLIAGPPRLPGAAGTAPGWVGPVLLSADGDPEHALYATHAERHLRMKGTEVFRQAVARISESSLGAVAAAGMTVDDVDLFVCHQANSRITQAVRTRLGLPEERVVDCIATLGNSSAATIPVALAHAQADGRLRPGTRVLLSAFGAGFTWGACVLHWGAPPSTPAQTARSATSQSGGAPAGSRHG